MSKILKILLDTHILIYAIDEDSKSQELLYNSNFELFTSFKNLSEFLSVVTKVSINPQITEDELVVIEDSTNILIILYPTESIFLYSKNCSKNIKQLYHRRTLWIGSQ